jgi:hypothetical protein
MPDNTRSLLSRRTLLKAGALTFCGCLAGLLDLGLPGRFIAHAAGPSTLLPLRPKLVAEFQGVCQGVEALLGQSKSQALGQAVARDALRRFDLQVPELAWLGGEANPNQTYLIKAGWFAAIAAAYKERGGSAKEIGRLFNDLHESEYQGADPALLRVRGEAYFSPANRRALQDWAGWTQKRTYKADWVAQVRLDGPEYDIAVDYLECGAVKYFRAQGLMDVAPYFCLTDFERSRQEGTGLARQSTLALGAERCDFRYKRGRAVTQNWATEVPRFPAA